MVSWVRGKCVGKGSFGTVTLGVNVPDGAVFAVKSVDRNSGLPGHVEALENEIRILRSLSSPYVVGFLGDDVTYESPTTSFRNLHMEYLPAGTVAKRCVPDVDERTVRSYTWCVVSALKYVHSRSIVHCDVKGRNILVGPSLNSAKLADFGSAIESSWETRGVPIVPRGSPLWMAPEVIRREFQGPESDVWSLGCTVIEMVTGKPAWEDHGADTLSRIGFSDDLPEFPARLSELGRDFLEKCLRRDPKKRWSCDQLLQHPFLSSSAFPNSVVIDSSPRCVLDWVNSEFEEYGSEENGPSPNCDSDSQSYETSARDRIGKLATTAWKNWESDGWVEVRALACDTVAAGGSCSGDEGEGTSTEDPEMMRTGEETAGTSARTSLEYSNSGGWLLLVIRLKDSNNNFQCDSGFGCACRAGSPCRCGTQKADFAVASAILSLLLFEVYLTEIIFNKLLFIFFTFYSWPQFLYACDQLSIQSV
ncbi:mitogen-activated protein kinase kinase kinase 17-like [Corylus avellana]|uniref:mitogen-activated protein kinase kinase kinase 17-like n=1 Tax=Corylus avellana TaxID=13451 RepID=UPI00286A599F|nr:mitogen-activated protein kinase kinase kinase 17-like [Corylus avellana]